MNLKTFKSLSTVVKESGHLLYKLDRRTLKIDDRPVSKLRWSKVFVQVFFFCTMTFQKHFGKNSFYLKELFYLL